MIDIESISISYGEKVVLSDFSMSGTLGELVVITGASGVGKTSIVNAILGFIQPSKGKIYVDGQLLSAITINSIRQKVAYLPQEVQLDLPLGNDLLLYPFTFKINKQRIPSEVQIHNQLQQLDLSKGLLRQKLSEMSLGQRQRIALASVLLLNKPILILDEPSASLDSESTQKVIAAVKSLQHTTVISVSHSDKWIAAMDRNIKL